MHDIWLLLYKVSLHIENKTVIKVIKYSKYASFIKAHLEDSISSFSF